MKHFERDEISRLPYKYQPLGAWAYFGYHLLFCIPLVGFICMIIFALSDSNVNRRNFARSFFCVYAIAAIAIVIFLIILLTAAVSAR